MLSVLAVTAAATAGSASAYAPIEGVWESTTAQHFLTLIQETSPEHFAEFSITGENGCNPDENGFVHPIGQFGGEDIGSGLEYQGFRTAFNANCEPETEGRPLSVDKIFSTDPTNYRKRVCVALPGAGPPAFNSEFKSTSPTTRCSEQVRVRPPEPPATAGSVVVFPGSGSGAGGAGGASGAGGTLACTATSRQHGRILRIKLFNPTNDPLVSAVIKVGSKTVLNYAYPAPVPPVTKIKLPAAARTVTIVVKTASGKTFRRKRHFGVCQAPHRRHRHHHPRHT